MRHSRYAHLPAFTDTHSSTSSMCPRGANKSCCVSAVRRARPLAGHMLMRAQRTVCWPLCGRGHTPLCCDCGLWGARVVARGWRVASCGRHCVVCVVVVGRGRPGVTQGKARSRRHPSSAQGVTRASRANDRKGNGIVKRAHTRQAVRQEQVDGGWACSCADRRAASARRRMCVQSCVPTEWREPAGNQRTRSNLPCPSGCGKGLPDGVCPKVPTTILHTVHSQAGLWSHRNRGGRALAPHAASGMPGEWSFASLLVPAGVWGWPCSLHSAGNVPGGSSGVIHA